ncbi:hypothetical protein H4R99_001206 [Coemansia sp. RSA 1722]|nr:hypothetical protein LPJ57_000518 [Coemansia sp. RSA 486]KAJ2237248.1 hypothetical protein IWW45_001123 [Coemansia sp. RSA 485]KAJ2601413.1 hypothetical protein GGF39_001260 [Coemansia sp. RSA 1721]KAJ2605347.1 hypothetical protein H4R99_001206 [Coemansia sp. RSA 1722]KAJ2638792.1 hypothetical protein GGF40_001390 [Coemansia sp. RSA 1286]
MPLSELSRLTNAIRSDSPLSYSAIPAHRPPLSVETSNSQRKGVALITSASLSFALMTLAARMLSPQYTSAQILQYSGLTQTLIALLSCLLYRIHPFHVSGSWEETQRWLVISVCAQSLAYLLYYTAVARSSMGMASALFATNCVAAMLLDTWIRGTGISQNKRKISAVCLVGIVLALLPNSLLLLVGGIHKGRGLALTAALFMALAHQASSRATGTRHPLVHIVHFGLASSVLGLLSSLHKGDLGRLPATAADAGALVGVGAMAFLSQMLMTRGLQLTNSVAGAVAGASNVIFCFVMDAVLNCTFPSVLGAAGALAIMYSATSLNT